MNRYSAQQISKVMIQLSENSNQRQPSSEFDDRIISQIPSSKINHKIHCLIQDESHHDHLMSNRKDKIKNKIKNQFRKKIIEVASHNNLADISKSPIFDVKQKVKRTPVKINSQIFNIKNIPVPQEKNQMPVNEFLKQQLQMSKYIMKKDVSIRSRPFNKSAMVQRNKVHSSIARIKERRQPATPAIQSNSPLINRPNPESLVDGLQPWRYAEETSFDEPIFVRKRWQLK